MNSDFNRAARLRAEHHARQRQSRFSYWLLSVSLGLCVSTWVIVLVLELLRRATP